MKSQGSSSSTSAALSEKECMSSLLIQFDLWHCPHAYVQGKWFFQHPQRLDEQSDLQLRRITFNIDGGAAFKPVKTG